VQKSTSSRQRGHTSGLRVVREIGQRKKRIRIGACRAIIPTKGRRYLEPETEETTGGRGGLSWKETNCRSLQKKRERRGFFKKRKIILKDET